MKRHLVCIVVMLISTFSNAQHLENNSDSLSRLLNNYLVSANKAYKFNGSVLVAQKGRILLHKAYGWANVTAEIPNDTLTHFPILSLNKSFTAIAVLKLQEEGKLSIKDKLSKYFPDYGYEIK